MKIHTSQIRSLETIEKSDGKYLRIGYVNRPNPVKRMRERTKRVTGNLWKHPVVKTVVIAITVAVSFELITRLIGLS